MTVTGISTNLFPSYQSVNATAYTPSEHIKATPKAEGLHSVIASDTIAPATSNLAVNKNAKLPLIDAPNERLLSSAQIDNEALLSGSLESIMYAVHIAMLDAHKKHTMISQKLLVNEQQWHKTKIEQKNNCLDEISTQSKQLSGARTVEKIAGATGIAISGGCALLSGITPLAIGALAVGALFTLDHILDDAMKKTVASWISQGDKEQESVWVSRIQMFSSLVSLGFSFGISGPQAVNVALKATQTAVSGYRGYLDNKMDSLNAYIIEHDSHIAKSDSKQQKLLSRMEEMMRHVYHLYENMHLIEQERHKISSSMITSIG